jgi:RepB DNA-primase from phage plasmid
LGFTHAKDRSIAFASEVSAMSQTATDFLTRCFALGETIALLLRGENGARPVQRIVRLEQAITPAYLRWLAHENHAGANVYVAANPLRSGSRRRTKESIAFVRHLYIDIDTDGDARIAALRASDAVPWPTAILATSPGKYQALWRVEGFDFEQQETALKQLAIAFGGDPACTDCNRVLRVPGYLNCKYSPAHPVAVEYPCDSTWNQEDFHLNIAVLPLRGITRSMQPGKQTHSEADWSWVLDELSHGKDAEKLTHTLAERRADKPNPLYYAQRTVDVASARLWLLEGAPIDDVITMLEVHRRFEIPASLCSARAREIATTAQRMIARKKIA